MADNCKNHFSQGVLCRLVFSELLNRSIKQVFFSASWELKIENIIITCSHQHPIFIYIYKYTQNIYIHTCVYIYIYRYVYIYTYIKFLYLFSTHYFHTLFILYGLSAITKIITHGPRWMQVRNAAAWSHGLN